MKFIKEHIVGIFCGIIIIAMILAIGYPYIFGNKRLFDTKQKFNYAVIQLPNNEIVEGNVSSWTDYEDGEQIEVTFTNGDTYLTSSFNCTLIDK